MERAVAIAWEQWSQLMLPLALGLLAAWRWRNDLSFERLRPYGVPRTTARLMTLFVGLLLAYCLLATTVEILLVRLPIQALVVVPAAASALLVAAIAGQLLPRDALWALDEQGNRRRIRWGRFFKVISSPVAAALAPISNVAIYRAPDVLTSIGIA